MVSDPTYHKRLPPRPRARDESFEVPLEIVRARVVFDGELSRQDLNLNHPPTAVGGIEEQICYYSPLYGGK